jgi:hypothetical protein
MSRIQYLAKNPKRSLGTLGVVLAAAGLTAGSGAFFSDTSASNGNSVAAGTLDILVKGSGAPTINQANDCAVKTDTACVNTTISDAALGQTAVFTASNFVPTAADHVVTRRFQVENKGTAPARVKLTSAVSTSPAPALADAMKMSIRRVGGDNAAVVTNAAVSSLNTEVLIPGQTTWTYEVDLNLLESGSDQNGLQGQSFSFGINAAARNQTAPAA